MVASSLRFWDVWLASVSNKKMNEHRRLVTIVCSKICSGIMSIPVGRGSTYCFTVVHVSVSLGFDVTPKGNPAQIFLGGMFFVSLGICI